MRFPQFASREFKSHMSSAAKAQVKPFENIPGPKPLPIIGNIWRYLPLIGDYRIDTLFENAQLNQSKYGPIVREQITKNHTILHLFDPNDIESLFRQDGKFPYRRSHRALLKYRQDRPELYQDGGLFPENGPNWHRQRAQFQQRLMSESQVSLNIPKLDQVSSRAIKWIESTMCHKREAVIENFQEILTKWALANSLSLFLDVDIETLDEGLVRSLIENLSDSLSAIDGTEIKTEKWVRAPGKCPFYRKLVDSQGALDNFVQKQVSRLSSRRDYPYYSYLDLWLHKDQIHLNDVRSFIMDSLLAGLHTTSYTLAFLLYHVSENDAIQDMLVREVRRNLCNKSIDRDSVKKSTILRDCLKETMRLNPVSIGTGRLVSRDGFSIRGYQIPNGTMVIAQTQASSINETIYDEPDQFKPNRWAEYRSLPKSQSPSPFASLPFGFGTRACIGKRLAELQIKLMAARLLQHFELKFDHPIKTKTTLIHNIDRNVRISIRKRLDQ